MQVLSPEPQQEQYGKPNASLLCVYLLQCAKQLAAVSEHSNIRENYR